MVMIKIKIKKKKGIPLRPRLAVIVVLSIIVVGSSYSAYAAFYTPLTVEKDTPVAMCTYCHTGVFDYIVYLKNNSVYDNAQVLLPGEGTIFKKITDHINASFRYTFTCDHPLLVQGWYRVVASLDTDIWEKEYELIAETDFNGASVTIVFPINYSYFEKIVTQINEETGVNAGGPTLSITCIVSMSAESDTGDIHEVFMSSLSIPLGRSIIVVNGPLSSSQPGTLVSIEKVAYAAAITGYHSSWSLTALIFFIVLVVFLLFTTSTVVPMSKTQKMMKALQKKYSDWIVEVEKPPKRVLGSEIVLLKSLEDIVKISEELGKPIMYHKSLGETQEQHTLYVLDELVQYKYVVMPP